MGLHFKAWDTVRLARVWVGRGVDSVFDTLVNRNLLQDALYYSILISEQQPMSSSCLVVIYLEFSIGKIISKGDEIYLFTIRNNY